MGGGRAGRATGLPLGSYLGRRALRILPAYWLVVLVALPVLNPGPARHAWPWVQYLLLVQNYDPHPWWAGTGAAGLAQDWSLVVEVSFYLVLPVLAALLAWYAGRAGWVGWRTRPATTWPGAPGGCWPPPPSWACPRSAGPCSPTTRTPSSGSTPPCRRC